jgi:hypothetical protein
MQERLKAIIAGFGCNPPSPDYLRLLRAIAGFIGSANLDGRPSRSCKKTASTFADTGCSWLLLRTHPCINFESLQKLKGRYEYLAKPLRLN